MVTRRQVMQSTLLAAAGAPMALNAAAPTPAPALKFCFEAHVTVDKPLVIGPSARGLRRVIPITGGEVTGPRLKGNVVPGGADWQFVRPDGVIELEAKYTLQSHDGVLIMVTNGGMRHAPPDVLEKLTSGGEVPRSAYYFRTHAAFEAPNESAYAWMNKAVFIGDAERTEGAAIIRFFRVA